MADFRGDAFERLFEHGGDINSAAAAFPDAPRPWLDLSTGINPVPYPLPDLPHDSWTRLPSPAELAELEASAARRYGVAAETVVAAPGAQALIQWLPHLFPARAVAIPAPTYGGHASAWAAAGAVVETAPEALAAASHAVLVSPNNPDGRRYSFAELGEAARRVAARGGLFVVDEAFADFEPRSFAAERPPATVVLRSFGKAYGLAGVRLGFALAPEAMARQIKVALGPWPVSGAAIAIGRAALDDAAWLAAARRRLKANGEWLDEALARRGFEILGGTPLFRLARRTDARAVMVALCERGVLARPFRDAPQLLRFGLPRPENRARVSEALEAL